MSVFQTATVKTIKLETELEPEKKLAEYISLFREIGNLKRIRAATSTTESSDSIATRMFERAWGRIRGGEAIRDVALAIVTEAVIAAGLGAINAETLRFAKLSDEEIELVLHRAIDQAGAALEKDFCAVLHAQIAGIIKNKTASKVKTELPLRFVENLKRQPRSGATKAGIAKRIFDQPENHADHCLAVAVIGALLSTQFGANLETVFLTGLAHHFHNAYLPDSGFAGEQTLGEFLPKIFESFRQRCLSELPENLHEKIWRIFAEIEIADTPEARGFHAADVIDRVLQMRHHAEANEFTLAYALEEAELVHAGAVQNFHYGILRAAKLIE